jgi:hypothetical protein
MAISGYSALSAMSIPGTDGGTGKEGLLMPKLQYRFRVTFTKLGANDSPLHVTKNIVDVTRPNVTFPEIPLEIYNSRIYVAGKPTWEPITFNVRDDVNGQVAQQIGNQIQKQMDFQEQASAATGVDYKFTMAIEILDGGSGTSINVLEKWELYGCYLSATNYNSLNYGTNEAVTISCTVRYDNALQFSGEGASTPVGAAGVAAATSARNDDTSGTTG